MTARVAPTFSPVTDAETALAFLSALLDAGALYHCDDSAHDCLSEHGLPVETLDLIEAAMQATHDHLVDPCEAAMHLMDERDLMAPSPGEGQ